MPIDLVIALHVKKIEGKQVTLEVGFFIDGEAVAQTGEREVEAGDAALIGIVLAGMDEQPPKQKGVQA